MRHKHRYKHRRKHEGKHKTTQIILIQYFNQPIFNIMYPINILRILYLCSNFNNTSLQFFFIHLNSSCLRLIPESPRWLLSKGKEKEVITVLEKISKMNKRPLPDDLVLQKPVIDETRISCLQLFKDWKTAKKTLICWDLW